MSVSVQLLGPVQVACENTTVSLGGPKPRALLAMLALQAGATVSTDRLLDGLWGEEPPASATKLVQVYVSHLRKALTTSGADGVIVTRGHGYELHVDRSQVDVTRFERLLAQGAARDALKLWRGSPLSDVAYEPFAGAEIRRLTELRSAALEVAIDQDLEVGRHREVLPELESLLGEEPFRERLHAQRIVALYRCGRQADALEAYRHAREMLVNEVGVEPGPELRQLHDAILRQDPSLEAPVVAGVELHNGHAGPSADPDPHADAEDQRSRLSDVTQRLGELATRTSRERADWQIAEDELAAGVVELQDLRQRAAAGDATGDFVGSPFKGLESFNFDDADIFFGRERLVADLVARLPGSRMVGVIGASGSGKSSLLRAGLLPALAHGVLPGSAGWASAVIRPGRHPHRALQQAVDHLSAEHPAVLVLDQFEEAFTACSDEAERSRFIADVVALARDHRRRTVILIAIRADFFGHCATYPQLSHMLDANTVLVGPMRADELRRAIQGPARAGNVPVEPALVDALVADVEGQPGALPLLSTALLELWQQEVAWQSDGSRVLRYAPYRAAGGVQGAVARLAEAAYNRLDPEQQQRAKRLLLRLAGDGGVRLRVPRSELGTADEVIAALAADRLVTVDEDHVDVAHEALLREWPRLVEWLDEDAEGRRLHRHLTSSARDWDASGRDAADLYRGSRLAAASEWATAHLEDLNHVERDFVAASIAADQAEARSQRTTNRRLRTLLSGVAGLLVLALAAGAVALWQRREAQDTAVIADARRLGAEALTREQLDDALLLASAGVELRPTAETYSSLLSVLLRQPAMVGELRGDGSPLTSASVSDDGTMIVTADEGGAIKVFDLQTRKPLTEPYRALGAYVQNVAFSPDGRTVVASLNGAGSFVDLIDARTGTRQARFQLPTYQTPSGGFPLFDNMTLVFHPNGRDLIVQQSDGAFFEQMDERLPGGGPPIITRLDGETGEVMHRRYIGRSNAAFFQATADRRRIFVTSPGDDATYELDSETLRLRRTYPVGDYWSGVSPDGTLLALGSSKGAVRLVELASGRARRMSGRHEDGEDMFLAFTPDGRTLVSSADSGEVIVWDVPSGRIRERLDAHEQSIWRLLVAPDGRTLYTAANDGRVAMWDLAGDQRLHRRFDAGPPLQLDDRSPKGMAASPDGRLVAVAQRDGTVDLLDATTFRRESSLRAEGTTLGLAFSPDGQRLAGSGAGGYVTIWDVQQAETIQSFEGAPFTTSQSIAFSQDGRHVLVANVASEGGRVPGGVRMYDVATGEQEPLRFSLESASIAVSPDGRLVAAAGLAAPSQVHDLRIGAEVATLDTGDVARTVAFSPDGKLLAVGHFGGGTILLSTDDYQQVGRRMTGQTGRVTALQFSPDGSRLLTGNADGTVQLWDAASQQVIGAPLTVKSDAYIAAAFTPDGDYVIAVPDVGSGVRWDVRESSWQQHACAVAGREFSAEEWRRELPGRPFRQVCAAR